MKSETGQNILVRTTLAVDANRYGLAYNDLVQVSSVKLFTESTPSLFPIVFHTLKLTGYQVIRPVCVHFKLCLACS